jgi:hypothetical protein
LREQNREASRLRQDTRDLPKLRNEVHQLREQRQALDRTNARYPASRQSTAPGGPAAQPTDSPGARMTPETVSNAGMATPEATLQTFTWAMLHGEMQTLKTCVDEASLGKIEQQGDEQFRAAMTEVRAKFQGFRIVA